MKSLLKTRYFKKFHIGAFTAAFAVLTGCASYYRVADIENHKKESPKTFRVWKGSRWRYVESINPESYKLNANDPNTLFNIATGYFLDSKNTNDLGTNQTPTLIRAKLARNELQGIMIGLSDKEVSRHLSEVTGTQITVNMVLGAAALGTSGAGAVATTAMAKVFSAMAAGFTGVKSLFNEEVYRNALIQTLVGSIISKRNEIRAEIEVSQEKSIHDYSVTQAINDVRQLNESGSFYYGLTLIREAADATNAVRNAVASEPKKQALRASGEKARTSAIKAENERLDLEIINRHKLIDLQGLQPEKK
jgi:hypothetical protein